MPTRTGTGVGKHLKGKTAVTQALQAARARLGDGKPGYGLLFVSPDVDLSEALATARSLTDAPFIGCTTAGELTQEGLVHGGVAAMIVASDATTHIQFARSIKSDLDGAVRLLSSDSAQARRSGGPKENKHLTTVLLTDGLSGVGERLVNDLYELRLQTGTQIVGGAAGDEGKFAATFVGAQGDAETNAAAALHVFSAAPWGVGVDHGLRSTTKQMRETKADANVVYEIDGRPAFAAYEKHAADRGVRLTRETASAYLVANELGIHFFERIGKARAPLSVGTDGHWSARRRSRAGRW